MEKEVQLVPALFDPGTALKTSSSQASAEVARFCGSTSRKWARWSRTTGKRRAFRSILSRRLPCTCECELGPRRVTKWVSRKTGRWEDGWWPLGFPLKHPKTGARSACPAALQAASASSRRLLGLGHTYKTCQAHRRPVPNDVNRDGSRLLASWQLPQPKQHVAITGNGEDALRMGAAPWLPR